MDIKDLSKDGKGEVLQITMHHIVNVGKQNAIVNFKEYLSQILGEFEHEITRTVYGQSQLPPIQSHIIVPD